MYTCLLLENTCLRKMSKRKHSQLSGKAKAQGKMKSQKGEFDLRLYKQPKVQSLGTLLNNIEFKYYDLFVNDTCRALSGASAWGTTDLLMPASGTWVGEIIKGDDINQRAGRRISVHSIRVRGYIAIPADTTPTPGATPFFRFFVINDKISNGAQGQPGAALEPYGINTFHNKDELIRYGILKEKVIKFPSLATTHSTTTSTDTEGYDMPFKFNLKFKMPLEIQYNQLTIGDYTSLVTNNVFLCGCASNSTYADISGNYTVRYAARIGYTDSG